MTDIDDYHEQLWRDAKFLCSDQRMDTELVDRLVLQLNRIYPQILSDKEAHRFRKLCIPTKTRLAELLKHLHGKGEEACHEFYRGLHIHAEDVYSSLPTRVIQREVADPKWTNTVAIRPQRHVLNDRVYIAMAAAAQDMEGRRSVDWYFERYQSTLLGTAQVSLSKAPPAWPAYNPQSASRPVFFLSCFSFAVGVAMLYYYGEGETLRSTGPFLHCSAARFSKGAKDVFVSYAEVGKQKKAGR